MGTAAEQVACPGRRKEGAERCGGTDSIQWEIRTIGAAPARRSKKRAQQKNTKEPSAVLTTSPVTLVKCGTEVMTWYPARVAPLSRSLSLFLSLHMALPGAPPVLFQTAADTFASSLRSALSEEDCLTAPRRLHHPGLSPSTQQQGMCPREPGPLPPSPHHGSTSMVASQQHDFCFNVLFKH